MILTYVYAFFIAFIVTTFSTPLVKKLAIAIGAVDRPDARKIHVNLMPRLGGLSIVIGALAGGIYLAPTSDYLFYILIGALVIIVTGVLDDRFILSAKIKLGGQLLASLSVVLSGLKLDTISIPFGSTIELGYFGYVFAIIWIIGVTNAVNLMDGLDGLAAGISTIALSALMVISIINQNLFITSLCIILIAGSLGFLIFNFYPAKIFMGDTGALFLGFSIAVISLLTLTDSTNFSNLIVPVVVLAIPIIDTLFAIIRRVINKKSIYDPDKNHLHHRLLKMGNSHRKSVLLIYAFGLSFGVSAIVLTLNMFAGTIVIIATLLIGIYLTAKILGLFETDTNANTPQLTLMEYHIQTRLLRLSPPKK